MLRIGLSEVDITPAPGLRMAGMLNPPKAEGVNLPLYARIFVFDDGIHQVAVCVLDLLALINPTVAEFRQAMAAGTLLKPQDILITCSHTHRGPYTIGAMDEDMDFDYLDLVRERLVRGMTEAWCSLQPGRLKVGRADAPGWTFNRRQVYRTPMGEQVGTQGPEWIPEFIRREGPEDNEISILTIEDEQGKIRGGWVNFACHPTVMGSEPVYTADFPGALTEALKQKFGGIFGFIQGCAGNLWSFDMSHENLNPTPPVEQAWKMAAALTEKAVDALAQGHLVGGDTVGAESEILQIPLRRPTREQMDLAVWYLTKRKGEIDEREFTRKFYGHEWTFYSSWGENVVSEWFSWQTISLWEIERMGGKREYCEDVEVQIIRIGDVALVGYPSEIFTEFGLKTKKQSPCKDTFVAELANGWHGYVPTPEAYAHGGYETRLGYTSKLIASAGDAMVCAALKMLRRNAI